MMVHRSDSFFITTWRNIGVGRVLQRSYTSIINIPRELGGTAGDVVDVISSFLLLVYHRIKGNEGNGDGMGTRGTLCKSI